MNDGQRPWAVVTGASSGIGYELARLFARDGIPVVLVARNEARLQRVARELGSEFGAETRIEPCDLSRDETPERLHAALAADGVCVGYLVNNAGFGRYGPFADMDVDAMIGMVRLNVIAVTRLTRLFLPAMLERGSGRILNVASLAGYQPGGPRAVTYWASKSFVLSFTRGLSVELRGTGVRALALCPGPTRTGFEARGGFARTWLYSALPGSARRVARTGYRAMRWPVNAWVPGVVSKILALGGELPPRRIALELNNLLLRER